MAFDMNEFLASPGYAMANQALNNIYGLRRNQVPTASPADAYQQTVQRRVQLQANPLCKSQQVSSFLHPFHCSALEPPSCVCISSFL